MTQLKLYIDYYDFVGSDAFRYITPHLKQRIIYYNYKGTVYYR